MRAALAASVVSIVAVLCPVLATAQSSTNVPTMHVNGIIADLQAVNCTSSDSSDCKTLLVVTAGPTKQLAKPGHSIAVVAPVTVVVMPHTPFTWTRFHRTVRPSQLRPGDAVDIDYTRVGGENVATRVDVSLQ
jgi:hypothetical protein